MSLEVNMIPYSLLDHLKARETSCVPCVHISPPASSPVTLPQSHALLR